MATRSLFFDESGFTGADLLNPDQPHFCVGTSWIEDDLAADILRSSFSNYQGAEFKFANIWRRPRNRGGILTFASRLKEISERLFVYWIDKKFCVLTKLVDFLVEPPVHAAGFDFYSGGYAPRYCNMWFFGIKKFATVELYDSTVKVYQQFVRSPSLTTLSNLRTMLHVMANSVPPELEVFYRSAALGADTFLQFHDLETHRDSNEIQLTTVLQCIAWWRNKLADDFAVFHDASSNFFRSDDLWSRVTSSDVPEQLHDSASGTPNRYPLRVISTQAVDSKNSLAIQLCDLLAGLAAKQFRVDIPDDDRKFLDEVLAAGFDQVTYDGIRPEPKFPDGAPSLLAGADVVDQLTNIMFPERERGER
jgi:hypothetical protein